MILQSPNLNRSCNIKKIEEVFNLIIFLFNKLSSKFLFKTIEFDHCTLAILQYLGHLLAQS